MKGLNPKMRLSTKKNNAAKCKKYKTGLITA